MSAPNLSRRPFVNRRPVWRVTWILWVLGGVCFLINVALYWSHVSSLGDRRDRLATLDRQIDATVGEIGQTETQLAGMDIEWQGTQVQFLNRRLAERAFPWSRLFDRLEEVLPRDVRLERLTPRFLEEGQDGRRSGARRSAENEDRVALRVDGVARSGEALLEFVDNLFAHPAFVDPSPSSEAQRQGGRETGFDLTVVYLPQVVDPETEASESGASESGASDSGAPESGATESGATESGASESGASEGGASGNEAAEGEGAGAAAEGELANVAGEGDGT